MRILEFIFKLLWQFINFEPGRFEELREKAYKWQNEQDKLGEENPKWYHKLLKYDQEWWFQVALAIFFLFAFKSVRQWLASDPNDDQEEEYDDDGEDEVRHARAQRRQMAPHKF